MERGDVSERQLDGGGIEGDGNSRDDVGSSMDGGGGHARFSQACTVH